MAAQIMFSTLGQCFAHDPQFLEVANQLDEIRAFCARDKTVRDVMAKIDGPLTCKLDPDFETGPCVATIETVCILDGEGWGPGLRVHHNVPVLRIMRHPDGLRAAPVERG
jgi:hypothetical protein